MIKAKKVKNIRLTEVTKFVRLTYFRLTRQNQKMKFVKRANLFDNSFDVRLTYQIAENHNIIYLSNVSNEKYYIYCKVMYLLYKYMYIRITGIYTRARGHLTNQN